MTMDDSYLTIDNQSEIEIKIKGSRFIGRTYLVDSVTTADIILDTIRKEDYKATHHCYAYLVIENDREVFMYSDDGEPSGTAGRPIYDVVKGSKIVNLLLIVTRYFGGTKLGTGGLVKAYSETAKKALDKAGVKENYITDGYKIEIEFGLYDKLLKTINELGGRQVKSEFSDIVYMEIEIRKSLSERLYSQIIEISQGKAKIEKTS